MSKKTCPWCEGKGVVGKLVRDPEPEYVTLLGRKIPVVGTMVDQPCRHCGGAGEVDAFTRPEQNLFDAGEEKGAT